MGGTLADRLASLREAVARAAGRAGRRPEEVRIVAVTKTLSAERVREATQAGLLHVGENYIQEAETKRRALEDVPGLTWHFIGRLQTNKVKTALRLFAWIHSVDRLGLLEEIARRCGAPAEGPEILLQVNLEADPPSSSKAGFAEAEVEGAILAAGRLGLKVRGLMTMTPLFHDPEMSRPYYARLRALRDRLRLSFEHPPSPPSPSSPPRRTRGEGGRELTRSLFSPSPSTGEGVGGGERSEFRRITVGPTIELRELSMGMSGDFEVAVEEGATMIRVGTHLFGSREPGAGSRREGEA